ncbi:MAG TPA: hypothetical protein VFQ39_09000, partial [Longimicrobium sp.]|nr:hypothetical protein [Longimicrobium sp.]
MHVHRRVTPSLLIAAALALGACATNGPGGEPGDTTTADTYSVQQPVLAREALPEPPEPGAAAPVAADAGTYGYAGKVGAPLPATSAQNTEEYAVIRENEYRLARREPLSTFAIDV